MDKKRKRLEERLDALCKNIVRLESGNICLKCGRRDEYGDPHHIVPKNNGSSWRRFDLKNIAWVCRPCHTWWHDNWEEAQQWFKKKWSHIDEYLDKYRGGKPAKIKDEEMEDLIVEYKQKRQGLEIAAFEQATEIHKGEPDE